MTASLPFSGEYTEYVPSDALRPFVECLWTRGSPSSGMAPYHVLPDGCVDIMLAYRSGGTAPDAALAVGTMTRPLVVRAGEPGTFIGVRFWPGRAYPVLGMPAAELTDLRVDVGDVWRDGARDVESLDLGDLSTLFASFEQLLRRRLARAPSGNVTVDAAVCAIRRAQGNLSIAALAPALGVTRQYLARAFALHVGVPPKTFARVVRVRSTLERARVAATVDWAALALEAGYYDQAHLAGEVKELTGRSPGEWVGAS